jgi:hypothetical protein
VTTLDEALGAVLAGNWDTQDPSTALADFCDQLGKDPDLMAAAVQEKSRLEALDQKCSGQLGRRCVVSAVHLKALRAALG